MKCAVNDASSDNTYHTPEINITKKLYAENLCVKYFGEWNSVSPD